MRLIHFGAVIIIQLLVLVSIQSCNNTSSLPTQITFPNLIQNSSFEMGNAPTFNYWMVNTNWVHPVEDAPPGGGKWSAEDGPLTTFVTGQSGVGVFRLSAYIKPISGTASLTIGHWKGGEAVDGKSVSLESSGTPGWVFFTMIDTLDLHPTDSIYVKLCAGCNSLITRPTTDHALFDEVELKKIQ